MNPIRDSAYVMSEDRQEKRGEERRGGREERVALIESAGIFYALISIFSPSAAVQRALSVILEGTSKEKLFDRR